MKHIALVSMYDVFVQVFLSFYSTNVIMLANAFDRLTEGPLHYPDQPIKHTAGLYHLSRYHNDVNIFAIASKRFLMACR